MELPKNKSDLQNVIQHAVSKLFASQSNIFDFTAQTGQTEWNLAYHLAVELAALLPSLNCDLDVLKRGYGYGNRRPDIIFHERGNHQSNYLVVEMKRDGSPKEIQGDIEKIKTHWFKAPLHYKFGAVVNLCTDKNHQIEVLRNAT